MVTGKIASFVIGCLSVVVAVFNVTTLVNVSLPGCNTSTLARGHLQGGKRSSVINTNESTLISLAG